MKQLGCAFVVLLWFSACASGSEVIARWQRPGYQPVGFKKIAVVALSGQKDMRRSAENFVVAELVELGIAGAAVNDLFEHVPGPGEADVIRKRLGEIGADGVISLRIADRFVTSESAPQPAPNERYEHDFFWNYQYFYLPLYGGSTTVDARTTLVIDCTLYALDGGGPVASRELTLEPENQLDALRDGSRALVRSLNDSGALTGKK